jgi:hypothetical protein
MNPERLAVRLAKAVGTLDELAATFIDRDDEAATEIRNVATDLACLRLEIERETFVRTA